MHDPDELLRSFRKKITDASSVEALEAVRISLMGRNGAINQAMSSLPQLSKDDRRQFGSAMNRIKQELATALNERHRVLLDQFDAETHVDVTLPGTQYPRGSMHLTSHAINEISAIFERIGFIRASYPEVEWEQFAFEALNMPADHPARDDFETFFIDQPADTDNGKMVLTPHTSNGQVREMLRTNSTPPIRMINIGKTYRPNWDITHTPMFHQFEGLCIDRHITIAHLKGTIEYFVHQFFGPDRTIRLRPFHFQFTEPSFEIDITDAASSDRTQDADSDRQRLFKSGWLELGGAGMVHPNVLRAGGIDPDIYSGWAFGFGVERTFMMKEGLQLPDLRLMYSNDIRFLSQF